MRSFCKGLIGDSLSFCCEHLNQFHSETLNCKEITVRPEGLLQGLSTFFGLDLHVGERDIYFGSDDLASNAPHGHYYIRMPYPWDKWTRVFAKLHFRCQGKGCVSGGEKSERDKLSIS